MGVLRWLWGAALTLAALQPVAVEAVDRSVLVLGRISDDPKSHYDQLKPLLDYVVPRMRDVGIVEGRILMAKDAQQMGSYLRRGGVDWVTETAGTATNAMFQKFAAADKGTKKFKAAMSEIGLS